LRGDSAVTPDRMRRMQTDPVSAETPWFLPAFVAAAEADGGRDSSLARAARMLKGWDSRLTPDAQAPTLFEAALKQLTESPWDELSVPAPGERPRLVEVPQASVLAELMQDPDSPWWDDRSTPTVRERRDDMLRISLIAAWTNLNTRLGPPGAA